MYGRKSERKNGVGRKRKKDQGVGKTSFGKIRIKNESDFIERIF